MLFYSQVSKTLLKEIPLCSKSSPPQHCSDTSVVCPAHRKAFYHSYSQEFGNKYCIFSSTHYTNYDMLHNTLILPLETSRGQMPPDVIFNFLCWGECFLVLAMCIQSVPVPMATLCFHWRCHFSCHPFRIRHLLAEVLKKCLS